MGQRLLRPSYVQWLGISTLGFALASAIVKADDPPAKKNKPTTATPTAPDKADAVAGLGPKVLVPDTRIRLSPPAGSVPGEGFKGFQNPELGAVVEVVEMPCPFADSGLDAETFQRSGVTLKRRTDVKIGGRPAVLLALAQTANGVSINKWLLVFGDEKQTFLVAGIFTPEKAKELSPLLRACVLERRIRQGCGAGSNGGPALLDHPHDPLGVCQALGRIPHHYAERRVPARRRHPGYIARRHVVEAGADRRSTPVRREAFTLDTGRDGYQARHLRTGRDRRT